MTEKPMLTVEDLLKRWRVSRSTLYRWMGDPERKFPKALRRPRRKPMVWLYDSIVLWEESKT